MAVLAVVATGVGGSLAAKRGHCNPTTVAQSTPSSGPQVPNDSLCPTVNSTSNATASTLPTSDCDRLGKTYVSTIGIHTEFNVYCESDLGGADFLGVSVYFFEDYIETCATFKPTRRTMELKRRMRHAMGSLSLWTFIKIRKGWAGIAFLKMSAASP